MRIAEEKELLTETEAQQLAEKFLLSKYYYSKIDFSSNHLVIKDDLQTYQLQGEITLRSRSSLTRFTDHKAANKYDFKIEVDAQQGQVISYELR